LLKATEDNLPLLSPTLRTQVLDGALLAQRHRTAVRRLHHFCRLLPGWGVFHDGAGFRLFLAFTAFAVFNRATIKTALTDDDSMWNAD